MKHFKTVLLVTAMIIAFAMNAFPQLVAIGQSSEWEATGFNNGRRMVRDCSGLVDGYYHYVWHSQDNPANAPIGSGCDIFYACYDENGFPIINPINLTDGLGFWDNRYPSIAIENFYLDPPPASTWLNYNTLHVVWQCKQAAGANYEIMHGTINVTTPAAPPAVLMNVQNISQTPARHSLVPSIDINHYDPMLGPGFQQIHVVWQEENVPHAGAANASDIFYTRSVNSGINFNGPATGGLWDNITNTPRDSQMPSIACAIDVFNGFPVQYLGFDCVYPINAVTGTNHVHVAYNENTALGVHVYYLHSQNNGAAWLPRQDVTAAMGGGIAARDGYPNISCDMLDYVHIVFMSNVGRHSPIAGYQPGMAPNLATSFPGPNPGMYGTLVNDISYWSNNPFALASPVLPAVFDREFPTVALDRYQNVTINWHECQIPAVGPIGDYEVFRDYCFNVNAPARPPAVPNYGAWALGPNNDSNNAANDDLFPNLAHKKESMYFIRVAPFPGYTEIWNKVMGLGPGNCMAPVPKNVNSRNNVARDAAVN